MIPFYPPKELPLYRCPHFSRFFRTSAWMHVGRAMQEQRSGVPSSRLSILEQTPIATCIGMQTIRYGL